CGGGFVGRELHRWLTPADLLIGLDLSAACLERARTGFALRRRDSSGLQSGPYWVAGSATRLPLSNCCVQLATINASLHHVADPSGLLREIDRVLRPGGHLAIGFEPNARYFGCTPLRRAGAALERLCWYGSPRQNARRVRTMLAGGRSAELDDKAIALR